MRIILSM